MFTLLRMPNANRFLEVVEKSAGHAFLHLPDDTLIDVKKDHTTQQMFRTMDLGRNGLIPRPPRVHAVYGGKLLLMYGVRTYRSSILQCSKLRYISAF